MSTENRRSRSGSSNGPRRSSSSNSRSKGGSSRRFSNSRGGRPSRGRVGGGNRSRSGGRRGRKMSTFNPSQFINRNPVEVKEEVYVPKHKFEDFGLDDNLVRTVTGLGITTPSPIQDKIIPEVMNGHDVIGLAETGTGKTAAFLLPLIHKTMSDNDRQTLILTPTRELAIQIQEELRKLARGARMCSVTCVGGVNIQPQIRALKRHNNFVIGTPGRILDLINRKKLKTELVRTVVLDEADRMLDMGFIKDIRSILSGTPKTRETLFFSATMTSDAEAIVNDFLHKPVSISVKKKDVTSSIEQDVVECRHSDKLDTLLELLSKEEFSRVIIFGAMKHGVEKLSKDLSSRGVKAESIHGNKNHRQRQQSLSNFKDGKAKVLVATDVASRGIHVDDVSHVINYDLPGTFEDYVHRIGRTGRGTKRGKALTFVS